MICTIIIPENADIQLSIPKNYIGRRVEVTFLALDEIEQKPISKTMADFIGTLKNENYLELKKQTEQARKE